jgi:GT2 family glycosyltransferase
MRRHISQWTGWPINRVTLRPSKNFRFLRKLQKKWRRWRMPPQPARFLCNLDLLQGARPVTVVIPVHNAHDAFLCCIKSVLRYSDTRRVSVLLIDDASTDPRIRDLFNRLAALEKVTCIGNAENLGYTRSVNAGIRLSGADDVVLLNSDTVVGPRWLDYLRIAAYSASDVGTVTAISDNAGAFSMPEMGVANATPPGLTLTQHARLAAQVPVRTYPEVPTGSGFCMYLRRDMVDAVGLFDEQAFPRGYGEENDLCMRALRAGWRHLVCPQTLVHHVRSASFGNEKEGLTKEGRAEIDRRYPEYTSLVRKSFNAPPFKIARDRLRRAIEKAKQAGKHPQPRVLYVLSTKTGGTPQTSRDLAAALRAYCDPLLLYSNSRILELIDYSSDDASTLAFHELSARLMLETHRSREYEDVVAEWLVTFAVELVHIRHFAWHSLGLAKVCATLNIPVVLSFHDFYSLCPTVNLVTNQLRYCGGECESVDGDCASSLWPKEDVVPIKGAWNVVWRESVSRMLGYCDAFVTTSAGARQLLTDAYPEIAPRFVVIPHGRDFSRFVRVGSIPARGQPLRLLVPGNIAFHKGAHILKELAELDHRREIELHFLGVCDEVLQGIGIHHGPYNRDDFIKKVETIRPHLGAILSIWPETYIHTLTEMWACGLPVVAFDIGAAGERLRTHGGGWLIGEATAERVLETLERIRNDPDDYRRRVDEVVSWQEGEGLRFGTAEMAARYVEVYEGVKLGRVLQDTMGSGGTNTLGPAAI